MSTQLKDRIKVGLDEARMVVLVIQVLLGFQSRAAFEPGFDRLPPLAQTIRMVSFALLIVALALLLGIPAFHRVAARGENTPGVEKILRRFITLALGPFAIALGLDLAVATFTIAGTPAAVWSGVAVTSLALVCWYVFGAIRARLAQPPSGETMNDNTEPTSVDDKIKQMLTECRIVLPGTQAFLGFQLSAFLTDAFGKLPRPDQFVHLGALGLVALSGILLMTPPAYHRIGEKGEMTEHFLRLASVLLMWAMLPLALGISLDFYVVLSKATHSTGIAASLAGASFLTFLGFWFVFPVLARSGKHTSD